jgi:DNA-binding GntR family transcriptional regulator
MSAELEIKRTCIRDRVRDVLVARILDGTYPAGERLKELSLAREFNVSQAPIREALRELEASGLVYSERYRGTRVRGTDLQEMRESYQLRMILEVRSVELGLPYAPEVLASLSGCVDGMSRAFRRKDQQTFAEQALRMHRQLVQASGNRIFLAVWDSLHWEVRGRVALQRVVGRREGLRPFIDLHESLLARLRQADASGAAEELRTIFARIAALFSAD